jgi:WD40 repeat protein
VATGGDDGTLRLWDARTGAPVWRTVAVLPGRREILTQRGWEALGAGSSEEGDDVPRWRGAIDGDTRMARVSAGGETVCTVEADGSLARWDVAVDHESTVTGVGATQVTAMAGACLARDEEGKVLLWDDAGMPRTVSVAADAIGVDGDRVLVATDGALRVIDRDGETVSTLETDRGVTAVARVHDLLALGYTDGGIELVTGASGVNAPSIRFEDAPSTPVTALAAGPMDTVVVGWADGSFGLWGKHDGARLHHGRLHGPVSHLVRQGSTLIVASELGAHTTVDLSLFDESFCGVLESVWQDVPVVWRDGRPVLQPRPQDHPCR